jgi:hypothetical protein
MKEKQTKQQIPKTSTARKRIKKEVDLYLKKQNNKPYHVDLDHRKEHNRHPQGG